MNMVIQPVKQIETLGGAVMFSKEVSKLLIAFASVRKMIALLLAIVFCYLAVIGKVSSTEYTTVFTMVVGFYFGRSTALDVPGKKQNNEKEE